MGDFYQLFVKQRLNYKHFNCIGVKDWFVKARVMATGSGTKTMKGHHCYRCMCLYKECFDALAKFQFEKLQANFFLKVSGDA